MPLSIVVILCFIGFCLGAAAILMTVRDLFGRPATDRSLRRMPTVADELPAASLTGRLDQSFDRLVLESGVDASSVGAMLLVLTLGLLAGGVTFLWFDNPVGAALGAMLGMALGLGYFWVLKSRRHAQFREQLPYVLDLLARAVRAGESLDQAIGLVGAETPGAIGLEFRQCARQIEMGMSLGAAMRGLSRRVRMLETKILAATLTVHRDAGGNVATTMERLAAVMRDRLNFQRQMRATTGAGRFSARLISAAGPLLFIAMFFWQREHLQPLLSDPLGQTLLAVAAILEIVGLVWVVQLLQNEA